MSYIGKPKRIIRVEPEPVKIPAPPIEAPVKEPVKVGVG